ncbi:MAG: hypothetical protein AAGN66_19535 [Acidobacteriota bacterium]
MGFEGSLEKMQILAFRKNDFTQKIGEFSVYINPEKYTRKYEILYSDVQAQGSSSGTPEFNRAQSDRVTFELVFDGTGVVPSPRPGAGAQGGDGIADQVDEFLNLVFTYNGSIHSPNYLQLSWGTLVFDCRLTHLDITYTLFKPDGTPLRARANATFVEFTNKLELAKEENNTSPDLSHVITVKGGDTLPLLCFDVYGISDYYPQVARVNGLTNFRDIPEGTQLVFPPVAGGAS